MSWIHEEAKLNCDIKFPKSYDNNYLEKGFYIIEQNTKQLSMKLRINLINQLDTYYAVVKNKAISALANTIKQLHIQKNMHIIYKQDFYKNKEK